MPLRTITVVSAEPDTRASKVGFSSSRSETAARDELSTTPGRRPTPSARDSYSRIMRKRASDIHAVFARRLAHIGNQRLIGFKGHAFLQLPAQHGDGFLRRTRKLL